MSEILFVTEWPVEGGPDGIAIGPDGNVFVNINNNHRVVKYSPAGEPLADFPFEGESNGIAVSSDNEVFSVNNMLRVVKYSAVGELLAQWAV